MTEVDRTFYTLTAADKLRIARDTLFGRESDYFRFTLMDPSSYGGKERLEVLAGEIESLKAAIDRLEDEAAAEAAEQKELLEAPGA